VVADVLLSGFGFPGGFGDTGFESTDCSGQVFIAGGYIDPYLFNSTLWLQAGAPFGSLFAPQSPGALSAVAGDGVRVYYPTELASVRTLLSTRFLVASQSECTGVGGTFVAPNECCAPIGGGRGTMLASLAGALELGTFTPPFRLDVP
jgi:hypothetical protein